MDETADLSDLDVNTPGLSRSSGHTRMPDAELVARCCAGDRSAWRALYDRHAPMVYRFLSGFGIPGPEREDACQEVFLAIYRSLPRFRGEAQLSTWIYRIAGRTAAKLEQRRKFRNVLSALLLREPGPPVSSDPSEQASRGLLLERFLQRLHPKKRMVVVLFEIEGMPIEEIARVAGCPANTVWSRLHHGRLELAKMAAKVASKLTPKPPTGGVALPMLGANRRAALRDLEGTAGPDGDGA